MEAETMARGPRSDMEAGVIPLRVQSPLPMEEGGYSYDRPASTPGSAKWLRVGLVAAVSFGALMMFLLVLVLARPPCASAAADGWDSAVTFFVIGDWGRAGGWNQTEVAALMGTVGARVKPQFIISTGDNMYPSGLNSSDDPLFKENFSKIYKADSLQVPWRAVLGNHDWGDNAQKGAQQQPTALLGGALAARDARWRCERSYSTLLAGGRVELFLVDTNPFIERYRDQAWASFPGGLATQSAVAQLAEVEARLARSQAEWKLLVGHHPARSNGHHGNNSEVIVAFEPLIHRYGVQPRYDTIVSGAGSQCNRGFIGDVDSLYQHPWSGFVAVTVGAEELQVECYTLERGATAPAYVAAIPRRRQ
eukprot:scaffold1.g5353.t1